MKTKITLVIAFICSVVVLFGQVPTSGLVARYDFSNSTNFFNDGTVNSYNLCALGSPSIALGNSAGDSSAYFNGMSNAYYCGSDGSNYLSGSASFSAWFKVGSFYAYNTIAVTRYNESSAPYNSMNLFTGSAVNLRLSCAVSTNFDTDLVVTGNTVLQSGQWYHAVCTYDELTGELKLYLNGLLENSYTLSASPIIYSNDDFCIGHIPTASGANGFNGNIDQVLYYNRALTAEEVCEIYTGANCNLSPPAAPTNLTASINVSNTVDLTWVDNSTDESGFIIERSDNLGNNYFTINSVAGGVTSYTDGTTQPGGTYLYRVKAYNANGSSQPTMAVLITTGTVGVDEVKDGLLLIYPNPTTDLLVIESAGGQTASVLSLSGNLLQTVKLDINSTAINVEQLASGIYFLQVGETTVKFIKQ